MTCITHSLISFVPPIKWILYCVLESGMPFEGCSEDSEISYTVVLSSLKDSLKTLRNKLLPEKSRATAKHAKLRHRLFHTS